MHESSQGPGEERGKRSIEPKLLALVGLTAILVLAAIVAVHWIRLWTVREVSAA